MEQRSDRFHVQVSVGDHAVEMRATGEVDIATVGLLRTALWAAPARPLLRLDISGVRLLSAAGVRALIAAHRRVRARGGELVLVDPAPVVARVLHVTGLDRVIPVRDGAAASTAVALPAAAPRVLAPLALTPAGESSARPDPAVTLPEPAALGSLARALGSLVPVAEASSAPMLACV
ncbi:anti-sigma factor antagonist [Micromonospora sp. NEAU-HG-1]|nr:anti-sigma factor antagonist [Micromonospora rubida]